MKKIIEERRNMKFLDAVGPFAISKSVWSQLLDENEKGRSVTSFQDVSLDGSISKQYSIINILIPHVSNVNHLNGLVPPNFAQPPHFLSSLLQHLGVVLQGTKGLRDSLNSLALVGPLESMKGSTLTSVNLKGAFALIYSLQSPISIPCSM